VTHCRPERDRAAACWCFWPEIGWAALAVAASDVRLRLATTMRRGCRGCTYGYL
jgi:hypothetical protein